LKKKEDSVEIVTDYEHQKEKEYLKQQHKNPKKSLITTKMTPFKHSCKVLHHQNPLATPCGR
jgi:hypothetical protein